MKQENWDILRIKGICMSVLGIFLSLIINSFFAWFFLLLFIIFLLIKPKQRRKK
jgi:hypothetical protein